ncbi:MAG: methyltransferase domain-containing protein [Alphaproteobacteria bacterium]|nr:SAM-dependent methyltransferase [Hyphomonas sp.]MBR9806520.1 methyltransferase domain-containing protein [Alphaproteobacteria bacterium]|tara:strand:- start:2738 stop:3352 length:615 start_codon:yes stop_codon:yes gene_type:complete
MSALTSTSGYAEEADDLFVRYEALSAAETHAHWRNLFPVPPVRTLDIGAGTGRDAAWLVSLGHSVLAVEPVETLRLRAAKLHPEPEITWLEDSLPDLANTHTRGERFGMVMINAVWMHLTMEERAAAMGRVAALAAPDARLFISLRHGPIPQGRRMFDVTGEETIALAAPHGLRPISHIRKNSTMAENAARGVEWTALVFEKAT